MTSSFEPLFRALAEHAWSRPSTGSWKKARPTVADALTIGCTSVGRRPIACAAPAGRLVGRSAALAGVEPGAPVACRAAAADFAAASAGTCADDAGRIRSAVQYASARVVREPPPPGPGGGAPG